MTAKERWSHWHWTTRVSVSIGLITACWVLLTAAFNGAASLFVPRALYESDRNADQLKAALHVVRDSARQEDIYKQLRYLSCRADNPRRSCLTPPAR